MPKFLEQKLKKQYGANSKIPFKIMNAKGYMKGNKETPKGKMAAKKHAAKMSPGKKRKMLSKAADKMFGK